MRSRELNGWGVLGFLGWDVPNRIDRNVNPFIIFLSDFSRVVLFAFELQALNALWEEVWDLMLIKWFNIYIQLI